ncbi:hypothetical protein [Paenibacillus peoriae]|uniref:hypothetical protein n=1 Tax=Paenibacillus peoriae TaxID=59893 RepID=UPI0012D90DD6|nr:hypothetical protein [Paenibacillus peoriae]
MKTTIKAKCSKCGTTANKVPGQAWPKCCGLLMVLDEQIKVIYPDGEYHWMK